MEKLLKVIFTIERIADLVGVGLKTVRKIRTKVHRKVINKRKASLYNSPGYAKACKRTKPKDPLK